MGKKYYIKNNSHSLEAEEVFLDAKALESLEEKGKLEKKISRKKFSILYIIMLLGFVFLLLRVGQLQIVKGEYYKKLAIGNIIREYPICAPRGIIYDRNKTPLVYNVVDFSLVLDKDSFLSNPKEKREEILEQLSSIIKKPKDEIIATLENEKLESNILVLKDNLKKEQVLIIQFYIKDWNGIYLKKKIKRDYQFSPYFSHILGYVSKVSKKDLEDNPSYNPEDYIGRTGLELFYDKWLRGKYGKEIMEVNSVGKIVKKLKHEEPIPGNSLILNIDKDLQIKLYDSLKKYADKAEKKGVGIVLNPSNGAILSLVSLPSFDNNIFSGKISKEEYNKLVSNINKPFLNRAISGEYPPGSTIKPLIASAGLQEKIVSLSTTVNCKGGISVKDKYVPKKIWYFADWRAHGITDIIKAIAVSCNVYFYHLSGGYGKIKGLGIEKIKKYLQLFGLGKKTNIDLPNEHSGLIPDKKWKEKTKGEKWYIGDTYHIGIGQGDIKVTPIQIAAATSVIANKGTLYKPQIVDKIIDENGNLIMDISPEVIRKNFIDKKYLDIVRKGMREAVVYGSCRALNDLPVKVAGKTGTAQFCKDKTHAWFTGFAPFDNPEIVITILVEGGGEGHKMAVPVAKEVLQWYFKDRFD